jgi:hypothetical protein
MWNAVRGWSASLSDYPGWREWNRSRMKHTLYFDDPLPLESEQEPEEFHFTGAIDREHAVVLQYVGLEECLNSLKECEYYFRRYPFRGTPVTRYSHLCNVCEMYFSRFFQFKGRMKNYFECLKTACPEYKIEPGNFIKLFDKEFDQEMRQRNKIHHHERFEDVALARILVTESLALNAENEGWRREHLRAYRKLVNEWVMRVRNRSAKLEEFLEAIAAVTLEVCPFLSKAEASSVEKPTH